MKQSSCLIFIILPRSFGILKVTGNVKLTLFMHPLCFIYFLQGSRFPWGPPVVFGSCAVLVTILLIWIPETTGKELPNTVEDVKRLYTIKQIRSN